MLIADFDYFLPSELIAQNPLAERADSRMLYMNRASGSLRDCQFRDFPRMLRLDDLVVFNNTRVFPARLYGRKGSAVPKGESVDDIPEGSHAPVSVEVLLTKPSEATWECLVRPGRKIRMGDIVWFGDNNELRAEVVGVGPFGERHLRFDPVENFFGIIERLGHVPLPPYINRPDQPADKERYQTVFARERGSVAAPTAGLHFSPEIIEEMRQCGIETTEITLHVGLGTFQPIKGDRVEDHKLHRERYHISREAAKSINTARNAKRRVIAIGTTTVRALEYSATVSPQAEVTSGDGEVDLFIYPGYRYQVVSALLTNFHLPRSTLLMLVSAFAGRERVLAAYKHAVAEKYRFYSYGDCMFVE